MITSVNDVTLMGHVMSTPTLRHTNKNIPVTNFQLKTTRTWTVKPTAEIKKRDTYHKIVCWMNLAKIVTDVVKKGDIVYIKGSILTSYHPIDDHKVASSEIRANIVERMDLRSLETDQTDETNTIASIKEITESTEITREMLMDVQIDDEVPTE